MSHAPGTRTVTLAPGSDLRQAASTLTYDEGICSSPWLFTYTSCATQLQHCAQQNATSTTSVVAVFYETGILHSCTRLA